MCVNYLYVVIASALEHCMTNHYSIVRADFREKFASNFRTTSQKQLQVLM